MSTAGPANQQQTPAAGPKLEETVGQSIAGLASQVLEPVQVPGVCHPPAATISVSGGGGGGGEPPPPPPPPPSALPTQPPDAAQAQQQQDVRLPVQQPALASSQTSSSFPSADTRTHVVGELYDTERSYVESLQILVEKYMKPLKTSDSSRMLIESNLVDEIFYAIPKILQHHEIFLSALQDRISSDWDTSRVIGNVFIEAFTNQQIIDIYTAFINNWKNARQAIKVATQAKPAFERFLEAMSREHRNKLTLDALLIMPVQRIPRYELLIKELIKHTPDDHPDYEPLIEAQKQIHELALKIDHAEREMIHQEQLKDLECLIEGHVELQHPQRDFIRYDLVIITGTSSLAMAKKERVLFLFCDLLIMTSVKKKASRRSNLQTAFTNSFNDLSLLEGNKFKLLLRMPLDQIEVRLPNEQTQNYQQQEQHIAQQLHQQQQQQNKYLQERKSKIAADLFIMNQIEALSSKLHCGAPERSKLEEIAANLSNQLRLNLYELEQVVGGAECALAASAGAGAGSGRPISDQLLAGSPFAPAQPASAHHQQSAGSLSSTDLHANQSQQISVSAGSISGPARPPVQQQQQQQPSLASSHSFNSVNSYVANQASSSVLASQDSSNSSLEFLINSSFLASAQSAGSGATWDSGQPGHTGAPSEPISGERGYIVAGSFSSGGGGSVGAPSSHNGSAGALLAGCDSLVVTFSSIDRKQAFLQAFIEAKQHRYQLHQAQVAAQQQQLRKFPKVYSSSVTLKLSQGSASSHRSAGRGSRQLDSNECLHQQHLVAGSYVGELAQRPASCSYQPQADLSARMPSAPLVHQASDSAVEALVHQMSAPQSLTLTSAPSQEEPLWSVFGCQQQQQSVICLGGSCSSGASLAGSASPHPHERRDKQPPPPATCQPAILSSGDSIYWPSSSSQPALMQAQLAANEPTSELRVSNLHLHHHQLIIDRMSPTVPTHTQQQPAPELASSVAPKFLLSLPMKFLHTQHPGLQFTCSAGRPPFHQDSTSGGGPQIAHDSPTLQLGPSNSEPARGPQKRQQMVRDDSGQLWLCLSNGYVSHVALLSVERNPTAADETGRPTETEDTTEHCFNVSLVIQSTGDICKSHISCAAQVPRLARHPLAACTSQGQPNQPPDSSNLGNPADDYTQPLEEGTASRLPPASAMAPPQRQLKSMNSLSLEPQSQPQAFRSRTVTVPARLVSGSRDIPPAIDRCPRSSELGRPINSSTSGGTSQEKSGSDAGRWPAAQANIEHIFGASGGPILSALAPQFRPSLERINLVNHSGFHSHLNQHAHHHHHHHHHRQRPHSHQHHLHQHQHQHPPANLYGFRHNTVPLGELKKALESSQSRMGDRCVSGGQTGQHQHHSSFYKQRNNHLAPPSNTPFDPINISPTHHRINSLDLAHRGLTQDSGSLHQLLDPSSKKTRATTPPAAFCSIKASRSSRSLRHQASLKTSAILAKLVSSASKHYLRRSAHSADKSTHLDADTGPENRSARGGSVNGSGQQLHLGPRCRLGVNAEDAVVSPLSSVSSLISSNSSVTVNSACASSPKHSSCDLLFHTTKQSKCCSLTCQSRLSGARECGLRSRSATVPSPSSNERIDINRNTCSMENWPKICDLEHTLGPAPNTYQVNEIIQDAEPPSGGSVGDQEEEKNQPDQDGFSLWLGCDDGSLMVMDCLGAQSGDSTSDQNRESTDKRCDNRHLEIKLAAAISDIKSYREKQVFVAMNNGRLAIFSRHGSQQQWLMNSPKIVTLTSFELNFTSKLCIIEPDRLWYSYGRNIFVLDIESVKLEATIMVPTNDTSLKFSVQPMTIDNMEPMGEHGVWISFKNSSLIQLYEVKSHKLVLELKLYEPVNMMLSFGNEILRQHKTACLKATAMLSLFNRKTSCYTLFIGTSSGIVLHLSTTLDAKQVAGHDLLRQQQPQLASLRHGHSGHVNFLHLVVFADQSDESVILISGGKGTDVYGPTLATSATITDHQQVFSGAHQLLNSDDDNLNHLLLWRL